MKQTIQPAACRDAGFPARHRPAQQGAAAPAGHLAQLAAMMNESPRVRSLARLQEMPAHEYGLMELADDLSMGPPAIQRKEPEGEPHAESAKAGPALRALVAELEQLAAEAALLGGEEGAAESQRLREQLLRIQSIAAGDDEALKTAALNRLHGELSNLGVPAKVSSGGETQSAPAQLTPEDPVQRLTGLEIGLIVGGVVVGTALLAAGVWALVRRCRAARPTVHIALLGPQHSPGRNESEAVVTSSATLTHPTQRVIYEIRWDAAVVPGGNHLGQLPNTASNGWVVDQSQDGNPVGDRTVPQYAYYFTDNGYGTPDAQNGLHYYFPDHVQQRELNGGSWWFRIRVVDQNGTTLVTSQEQEIDWRH